MADRQSDDAPIDEHGSRSGGSWVWGPLSAYGLTIACAAFVLDQANKWWMINVYDIGARGRVEVMPFFDLVYVLNRGVSYSMFTMTTQEGQYLLSGFALIVAVVLTVMLARGVETRTGAAGVGLIIGGALGNAVDRLHLGGVADFYVLHAFGASWYVFNIADVAIVAGVVALLLDTFWLSRSAGGGSR